MLRVARGHSQAPPELRTVLLVQAPAARFRPDAINGCRLDLDEASPRPPPLGRCRDLAVPGPRYPSHEGH